MHWFMFPLASLIPLILSISLASRTVVEAAADSHFDRSTPAGYEYFVKYICGVEGLHGFGGTIPRAAKCGRYHSKFCAGAGRLAMGCLEDVPQPPFVVNRQKMTKLDQAVYLRTTLD